MATSFSSVFRLFRTRGCSVRPTPILRHPDMPRCIFRCCGTRSRRTGRSLLCGGISAHGDHYWVFAHVTPSYDAHHQKIGYHSMRRMAPEALEKVIPSTATCSASNSSMTTGATAWPPRGRNWKSASLTSRPPMMNLFSLSSLRWLCGLLSLVALAVAALLVGERLGVEVDLGGAQPWMAALLLLLSLATALVGLVLHRSLYQYRRITAAMAAAAAGDMEARLTHIPQGGEFSNLMHSTNRLLDQVDAFVREAGASMHHVAQQRYFRRILQRGLRGGSAHAETINQASGVGAKVSISEPQRRLAR